MPFSVSAREPTDTHQQISAAQWFPPSILNALSPCITQTLSASLQYVTTPSSGSISMHVQGYSVVLHGFTWSDRASMPDIRIKASQSTGVHTSINQTQDGDAGNGSLFKNCSPLTASVTGLDAHTTCTLTLEMTPGDSSANELVILTGFVVGPSKDTDPRLSPPPSESTLHPGAPETTGTRASDGPPLSNTGDSPHPSAPVDGAPENPAPSSLGPGSSLAESRIHSVPQTTRSAVPKNTPSTATDTAPDDAGPSRSALRAGIPLGILCLLALLSAAAYVRWRRLRRRRHATAPYWDRAARIPKEIGRHIKVQPGNVARDTDSSQGTEEIVALNAALREAGLTVPELIELCSRRRSAGSVSATSLPPGYASHASNDVIESNTNM